MCVKEEMRSNIIWTRKKTPVDLVRVAGACGLQNTPPGAWETAMWSRPEGCSLSFLNEALHQEKAYFKGGVIVVRRWFPTEQSDIFLTALISQEGEWPGIYTLWIAGALEYLQMPFDDLLARLKGAITYRTIIPSRARRSWTKHWPKSWRATCHRILFLSGQVG